MSRSARGGRAPGGGAGGTRPSRSSAGSTKGAAGAPVELRIQELAAGGAGVARTASGEVVFVAGAAPGDQVEVAIDRGSRPARGRVLRVISPGPGRVEPPCAFVTSCGGCDWMHLAPEAQQEAHAEIIRQAITRATMIRQAITRATSLRELPPIQVHAAPQPLGYRTRARLFAKAHRGQVQVGYRAPGTHALAAVDRCLVLSDALGPLLGELPGVLRGASGEGDVLVAQGQGGRPVVEIAWRGELGAETWKRLDARVAEGAWAGARVALAGVSRPASFGDPRPVIQGADGAPLVLAPGGFGQPSEEGASALARRVAELAWVEAPARPLHVVELFAGSGTLSVLLARGPGPGPGPGGAADGAAPGLASFVAVEQVPEAVACLRDNLAARGLAGKAVAADADAYPIPARADLVVLDPPRGGAPGAAAAIAASSVRSVVYVSCNPATLGRDLARITSGGLQITHVEAVELFPQTSHVEAIVRLARPRKPR